MGYLVQLRNPESSIEVIQSQKWDIWSNSRILNLQLKSSNPKNGISSVKIQNPESSIVVIQSQKWDFWSNSRILDLGLKLSNLINGIFGSTPESWIYNWSRPISEMGRPTSFKCDCASSCDGASSCTVVDRALLPMNLRKNTVSPLRLHTPPPCQNVTGSLSSFDLSTINAGWSWNWECLWE